MIKLLNLVVAALVFPAAANAAVLVDNSVDAVVITPGFDATNQTANQNFLSAVTFGNAVTVNGFDIYSENQGPLIGAVVTLRVRNDVAGSPDAIDLLTLASVLSAIDTVGSSSSPTIKRLHADFAPFALAAGNYWFGMSGESNIGLSLGGDFRASSGQNGLWQLSGPNLQFSFNGTTKAGFRVLGDVGAVPEPAAWALMIAGFAMTGAAARRRRAVAVA